MPMKKKSFRLSDDLIAKIESYPDQSEIVRQTLRKGLLSSDANAPTSDDPSLTNPDRPTTTTKIEEMIANVRHQKGRRPTLNTFLARLSDVLNNGGDA